MATPESIQSVRAALPFLVGGQFAPRPVNCPWEMAGPHYASARQRLMEALTGKRLPKAKCGVTAISQEIASRLGVPCTIPAVEAAVKALRG